MLCIPFKRIPLALARTHTMDNKRKAGSAAAGSAEVGDDRAAKRRKIPGVSQLVYFIYLPPLRTRIPCMVSIYPFVKEGKLLPGCNRSHRRPQGDGFTMASRSIPTCQHVASRCLDHSVLNRHAVTSFPFPNNILQQLSCAVASNNGGAGSVRV